MASSAVSGAGVVISAGKMSKTVTVRMVKRQWHRHLRKNYYTPFKFLVHDPNNSLVEGDVIKCDPERHTSNVKHVVSSILAPFGLPVDERPRVLTAQERAQLYDSKNMAKTEKRAARGVKGAVRYLKEHAWKVELAAREAARTPSGAGIGESGQTMQHGRTVLADGTHKYGARGEGGINEEAWRNKQKAMSLEDRAREIEFKREEVQSIPSEQIAAKRLHEQ